jgi:microcin C transport system ATP-binding protein
MSLLFITHDLGIVRRIADRVCVMKDGLIVEQGKRRTIFDDPRIPIRAETSGGRTDRRPRTGARGRAGGRQDRRAARLVPDPARVLRRTVGHVKAVNAATVNVREGETLGIVGESGSGKTTLALAVLRLISSDGPVVFMGRDIQGLKSRELKDTRRDMQVVFQDPYGSLSPRMTIEQIVAEGLAVHGIARGERRDAWRRSCRRWGCTRR